MSGNRDFDLWVRESPAPEPVAWRDAVAARDAAERNVHRARSLALAAFRAIGSPSRGPTEGAITKAEARQVKPSNQEEP